MTPVISVVLPVHNGGRTLRRALGDALGNHHVAFEAPGFASGSDQDPPTAAQTRLGLLDPVTRVAISHSP